MSSTPPQGFGIYRRDQSVAYCAQFPFVMVNAARADAVAVSRDLKARGVRVWLYEMPGSFLPATGGRPATWANGVSRCVNKCLESGADGIVADPENGWRDATEAEAEALGLALRDAAGQVGSVGLTSHSGLPQRIYDAWARGCGGRVWASAQCYAMAGYDRALAQSVEAATARFEAMPRKFRNFPVHIPSVSGWSGTREVDSRKVGTPEEYRAYLDMLPRGGAYIAWLAAYSEPAAWRTEIMREYSPGGLGGIGTLVENVRNGLAMRSVAYWVGVAILGVIALVAMLGAFA